MDAARVPPAYGKEMVKRYEGTENDRIRTMIFPYQFDASTKELLVEVKQASRELNVPVHMHTSQSLVEFHDCLRRYNKTPVQLLDSIGFLDPHTIITHSDLLDAEPGVWLSTRRQYRSAHRGRPRR